MKLVLMLLHMPEGPDKKMNRPIQEIGTMLMNIPDGQAARVLDLLDVDASIKQVQFYLSRIQSYKTREILTISSEPPVPYLPLVKQWYNRHSYANWQKWYAVEYWSPSIWEWDVRRIMEHCPRKWIVFNEACYGD